MDAALQAAGLLLAIVVVQATSPPPAATRLQDVTAAIARGTDNESRRLVILEVLDAAGLPYVLQSFSASNGETGTNIIVTLRGRSDDTIMMGAHYDRVAAGSGAVDNAAGCAALIELLRAFKAAPLTRSTLRAVFFDLEEKQLAGSRAYFATLGEHLPTNAVNLDVFGYGSVVFAAASTPDGAMVRALLAAGESDGLPVRMAPVTAYPPSDHRSMIAAGVDTLGLALLDPEEIDLVLDPRTARSARVASILHTPNDTMGNVRCDDVSRAIPVVERLIRLLDNR